MDPARVVLQTSEIVKSEKRQLSRLAPSWKLKLKLVSEKWKI